VQADFPIIQTVDGPGVGYYSSLALDSSGHPRIAYSDHTNGDLNYAASDGLSWDIQTVDSRALSSSDCSLALDSSGNPHISYYHNRDYWQVGGTGYCDGALEYATWNETSSTWDIHTVAENHDEGRYSSLALDSTDNPHIAYYRYWPYGNDLLYSYSDGSSWTHQMVDDGYNGIVGPSLALDGSGYGHISYFDYEGPGGSGLRYARWNGSSWDFTLVDSVAWPSALGYDTSLALDSSGNPHISYFAGATPHLNYAWYDGSSWDITTVDSLTEAGACTSLALDGSGSPHIAYYDATHQAVNYAAWTGSGWDIDTVDSVGGPAYDVSLALDSSGFAHISYYDATDQDLMYANNTPELSTLLLLGVGLPAAAALRRRKKRL